MITEQWKKAYQWVTGPSAEMKAEEICASRDVFRARLDRFYADLLRSVKSEAECALTSAMVGEIGNNCFDHNLGQWRDVPGCWFDHGVLDGSMRWIVIADRGQGVLSSLQRVEPTLKTDQEALEVAFSKVVSGRSPEKRGNGLKFVRQVINGHASQGLLFLSGKGKIGFGGGFNKAESLLGRSPNDSATVRGTFALIFGGEK